MSDPTSVHFERLTLALAATRLHSLSKTEKHERSDPLLTY